MQNHEVLMALDFVPPVPTWHDLEHMVILHFPTCMVPEKQNIYVYMCCYNAIKIKVVHLIPATKMACQFVSMIHTFAISNLT